MSAWTTASMSPRRCGNMTPTVPPAQCWLRAAQATARAATRKGSGVPTTASTLARQCGRTCLTAKIAPRLWWRRMLRSIHVQAGASMRVRPSGSVIRIVEVATSSRYHCLNRSVSCFNYCQYVGSAVWQYNPDCRGCAAPYLLQENQGSRCQSYCQHEPSMAWAYDANCQDCKPTSFAQESATAATETSGACADYCKHVGSALWQYDPDCQGCKASLLLLNDCMDYCKHEPSTVWQYDANCASCTVLAQSSPSNSQSSDKERVGVCRLLQVRWCCRAAVQSRLQGLHGILRAEIRLFHTLMQRLLPKRTVRIVAVRCKVPRLRDSVDGRGRHQGI